MDFSPLRTSAEAAARRLLGSIIERELDGEAVRCRIVETEAYDQTDAASHSYRGRTPRTDVMFGPAGYLYVYFTYGMHYCCNVVVGEDGEGAAVLVRAVEPLGNDAPLRRRRGGKVGVELTNGPAKTCQALGIDKRLNGHRLDEAPLRLVLQPPVADDAIVTSTRIGIKHAADVPWRFYIKDNKYVSRGGVR
ncbi:MAG TPA: DNA-3-methyladenine glycosylase [Candidatus Saccharimonadales bacterium]|nr:DNA-3-methyladenine glycosylase [Candidatus Saccharimonadales bacterium]